MKNFLFKIVFFSVMCVFLSFGFVFANENSTAPNPEDMPTVEYVTIDDAVNWIDKKGAEIIKACQNIAKPICMIMFIGSLAMAGFGIFGNSHLIGRGLFGCLIIALVYGAIEIAPFLLEALRGMAYS